MTETDPWRAVMMQVPSAGAFVRCILPVHLQGGHVVEFGVWLGVHPSDLRRAFDQWWAPSYADLVLEGRLGNRLPIWDLLGAVAQAQVLDPDATPFIVASDDPSLAKVLTDHWPHDEVLAAID